MLLINNCIDVLLGDKEIEMNMFDWKNYSSRHYEIEGGILADTSSEISKR